MKRMAEIFRNWGPPVNAASDLDLPKTKDWAITRWADSPDSNTRIELSESHAPRFRHIFGEIVSILECEADNAPTPFKFEVVVKLPFKNDGRQASERVSYVFARIIAYSADALIAGARSLSIGDPAVGALTASYGGS